MPLSHPATPFSHHPATAHINNPIGSPLTETPVYTPVTYHWFYRREIDGRIVWKPFSFVDSVALEEAYAAGNGERSLLTVFYFQCLPRQLQLMNCFYFFRIY